MNVGVRRWPEVTTAVVLRMCVTDRTIYVASPCVGRTQSVVGQRTPLWVPGKFSIQTMRQWHTSSTFSVDTFVWIFREISLHNQSWLQRIKACIQLLNCNGTSFTTKNCWKSTSPLKSVLIITSVIKKARHTRCIIYPHCLKTCACSPKAHEPNKDIAHLDHVYRLCDVLFLCVEKFRVQKKTWLAPE